MIKVNGIENGKSCFSNELTNSNSKFLVSWGTTELTFGYGRYSQVLLLSNSSEGCERDTCLLVTTAYHNGMLKWQPL